VERTDQGEAGGGSRTRDDGSRTSLRTVGLSPCGTRWVVPGIDPDYSVDAIVVTETSGGPPPGKVGGDEETRTPDPLLAKEMLFQLSYVPALVAPRSGGRTWTRTRDLGLIRAAL
jgi:hypothetical protein